MDARSLIEALKGRGLSLRLEGDRIKVEAPQEPDPETKALLSELRQFREKVKEVLAAPPPRKTGDSGDFGDKTAFGTGDRPVIAGPGSGYLRLVEICRNPVSGPVRLSPCEMVTDPEVFIEVTLADLESYVAAKNRGSRHWAENLIDEKIERLKLCGVVAQVRRIQ